MDVYNLEPGDMNDRESGAFHTQCMSSDMHVWIKHGQELVERLVRTHANLKLQQCLERRGRGPSVRL
jgi:hypothetical protein